MNDLQNKTIHCHPRFVRKRLAGEKIRESARECFNGIVDEKGYCRGAKHGESCTNNGDADCDVDLYCSERRVCEFAKLEGEYCNRKEKCASYLLCAWEDGVDSRCRPYGYHPYQTQLGPGEEDDICLTHYINSEIKCDHGPRIAHSNIRETPGEKCMYDHGENDISRCYYHQQGKALCRRGAGDLMDEWNIVLGYLTRKPACHVDLPMSQCDMGRERYDTLAEFAKIWKAISRLHWESQLEGLADCMKWYVHPEAFKYDPHYNGASFLTVPLALLLALILLFI